MIPFLANNAFYYFDDLTSASEFYQRVLGFPVVADYGFAKILQVAQPIVPDVGRWRERDAQHERTQDCYSWRL